MRRISLNLNSIPGVVQVGPRNRIERPLSQRIGIPRRHTPRRHGLADYNEQGSWTQMVRMDRKQLVRPDEGNWHQRYLGADSHERTPR